VINSARPRDSGCRLESQAIVIGHRGRRRLRRQRRERRLTGQRQLRALRRLRAQRHFRERAHTRQAARLGVAAGKIGVGGVGEVEAAVLLLALSDHHRPQHVVRGQHLRRVDDDDGAIASAGRQQRRGETEANGSVCRLLCCLGCEGGDFGGGDRRRSRPTRTGRDNTAHCKEHCPATSQRRDSRLGEGGLNHARASSLPGRRLGDALI
jgi:hypothetical protein